MSLPPPGTDELSWLGARSAVRRRVQAIVGAPSIEPTGPGHHAAVLIPPVDPLPTPQPELSRELGPAAQGATGPDATASAQDEQAQDHTPSGQDADESGAAPSAGGTEPERVVVPLGPSGIPPEPPAQATGPSWGLPGWLLFVVSMSAVLFAAIAEVRATAAVGSATGVTLIVCSLLSAVGTRRGDLPLAVMMPPLAFVVAVLVAGQLLVTETGNWKANQTLMIFDQLGGNARWVIAATALVVLIVAGRTIVGWLLGRRRSRQVSPG